MPPSPPLAQRVEPPFGAPPPFPLVASAIAHQTLSRAGGHWWSLGDHSGHDLVPSLESRALCLTKGRPIVDSRHALLLVRQQRLDHDRLDTCVMKPSGNRTPEIVQAPWRHPHAALLQLGVELLLPIAKAREASSIAPEYPTLCLVRPSR